MLLSMKIGNEVEARAVGCPCARRLPQRFHYGLDLRERDLFGDERLA